MAGLTLYTTADKQQNVTSKAPGDLITASDFNRVVGNIKERTQVGENILELRPRVWNGLYQPAMGVSRGTVEVAQVGTGLYSQWSETFPVFISAEYTHIYLVMEVFKLHFGNYRMDSISFAITDFTTSQKVHEIVSGTPGPNEQAWNSGAVPATLVANFAIPSFIYTANPNDMIGAGITIGMIYENFATLSSTTNFLNVTRGAWYGLGNFIARAYKA